MTLKQIRWSQIELKILHEAYKLGISLKVIGHALGRSPTSVNKILRRHGLRIAHKRPGKPIKTEQPIPNTRVKYLQDLTLMKYLMGIHNLTPSLSPIKLQPFLTHPIDEQALQAKEKAAFLLQLSKLEACEKRADERKIFVSGSVVERWAQFNDVNFSKHRLLEGNITYDYTIKGLPLTSRQFLLIINRLRISTGSLPFHVQEWDE